jgi:hypothetical protein
MGAAAAMADVFAAMLPELRATAERLEDVVPPR